jgi:transglutaminase-like putative cysteine protease
MKLSVSHHSSYRYETAVSLSPHFLYLRPRQNSTQRLEQFDIQVSSGAILSNVIDPLDNDFINAFFPTNTDLIQIQTAFQIETKNTNPFNFVLSGEGAEYPFKYPPAIATALAPYSIFPSTGNAAAIKKWLDQEFPQPPRETIELLGALNQLVNQKISYRRREELGIQSSQETLQQHSGTCRDFAELFVAICRQLGFAARFVSGYLYTPPDTEKQDPADNSMHAWTELYLPGAGWKGLDPTQGVWCDDCYIPVAHGAEALSVNPVQGKYFSKTPVASKLESQVLVTGVDA